MVTSNPVDDDTAEPPIVAAHGRTPSATAGEVKDGSVTVMLMVARTTIDARWVTTPSSVTLELTLTAIPPDDDEDMLFPLDPGQHHGESHLHRYAGWGR